MREARTENPCRTIPLLVFLSRWEETVSLYISPLYVLILNNRSIQTMIANHRLCNYPGVFDLLAKAELDPSRI